MEGYAVGVHGEAHLHDGIVPLLFADPAFAEFVLFVHLEVKNCHVIVHGPRVAAIGGRDALIDVALRLLGDGGEMGQGAIDVMQFKVEALEVSAFFLLWHKIQKHFLAVARIFNRLELYGC